MGEKRKDHALRKFGGKDQSRAVQNQKKTRKREVVKGIKGGDKKVAGKENPFREEGGVSTRPTCPPQRKEEKKELPERTHEEDETIQKNCRGPGPLRKRQGLIHKAGEPSRKISERQQKERKEGVFRMGESYR